jgi:hypothetical protein
MIGIPLTQDYMMKSEMIGEDEKFRDIHDPVHKKMKFS